MGSTRSRLRLGSVMAVAALALVACGEASSDGVAMPDPDGEHSESSETGGTETDSVDSGSDSLGLGDYDGLCGWTTPEAMEELFGVPMDAVGFRDCRVVAQDDLDVNTKGIYHVTLDPGRTVEDIVGDLKGGVKDLGARVCEEERSKAPGAIIHRAVLCPTGGDDKFQPSVIVQVGDGRSLYNMPFVVDSRAEAVEASHRFVGIMTSMAEGVREEPLINEVDPRGWVELYNPTDADVDVSGYTLRAHVDFDPKARGEMVVEDGSVVPAGGYLVVRTKILNRVVNKDLPEVWLVSADDVAVDWMDADADGGEVIRRNGDGGMQCAISSPNVTKGKANPPTTEYCDE